MQDAYRLERLQERIARGWFAGMARSCEWASPVFAGMARSYDAAVFEKLAVKVVPCPSPEDTEIRPP
jgi:hypothetical protein